MLAAEQGEKFGVAAGRYRHHLAMAAVARLHCRWRPAQQNGVMEFSGTAGQIREAFHTEIHNL